MSRGSILADMWAKPQESPWEFVRGGRESGNVKASAMIRRTHAEVRTVRETALPLRRVDAKPPRRRPEIGFAGLISPLDLRPRWIMPIPHPRDEFKIIPSRVHDC